MIRKLAWGTMTLLALIVGAYSGAAMYTSAVRPPFLQNLFDTVPFAISIHLAGGLVAIVTGAFQVNSSLRSRFLPTHRWLGRLYVAAVIVGALGGFSLALGSDGGLTGHYGFGILAVCWLFSTLCAFRHIRAGDKVSHRAWMLRSYALTLAAVMLRIYLPVFQMAGFSFDAAYPLISWICWVPNLLIVEWFILTRSPRSTSAATQ